LRDPTVVWQILLWFLSVKVAWSSVQTWSAFSKMPVFASCYLTYNMIYIFILKVFQYGVCLMRYNGKITITWKIKKLYYVWKINMLLYTNKFWALLLQECATRHRRSEETVIILCHFQIRKLPFPENWPHPDNIRFEMFNVIQFWFSFVNSRLYFLYVTNFKHSFLPQKFSTSCSFVCVGLEAFQHLWLSAPTYNSVLQIHYLTHDTIYDIWQTVQWSDKGLRVKEAKFLHKDHVLKGVTICRAVKVMILRIKLWKIAKKNCTLKNVEKMWLVDKYFNLNLPLCSRLTSEKVLHQRSLTVTMRIKPQNDY
jgi:hypothetical protein